MKLRFPGHTLSGGGGKINGKNFVLAGKAKTVFRLIELKAKREELARRGKKQNPKNKK